jgi:hypothetical protein
MIGAKDDRLVKAVRERCARTCEAVAASFGGLAAAPMATDGGKLVHEVMAAGAVNGAAEVRGQGEGWEGEQQEAPATTPAKLNSAAEGG